MGLMFLNLQDFMLYLKIVAAAFVFATSIFQCRWYPLEELISPRT